MLGPAPGSEAEVGERAFAVEVQDDPRHLPGEGPSAITNSMSG